MLRVLLRRKGLVQGEHGGDEGDELVVVLAIFRILQVELRYGHSLEIRGIDVHVLKVRFVPVISGSTIENAENVLKANSGFRASDDVGEVVSVVVVLVIKCCN